MTKDTVTIPRKEYESLKETLEILSNTELVKSLKRGIEDLKAGRVKSHEEIKKKYSK